MIIFKGSPPFPDNDSSLSEMLLEARLLEVTDKKGISECAVVGDDHVGDTLFEDKLFLSFFMEFASSVRSFIAHK